MYGAGGFSSKAGGLAHEGMMKEIQLHESGVWAANGWGSVALSNSLQHSGP